MNDLPTTTGVTDPNNVLQAIQQLAGTVSSNIPVPTIPTIGYTAPSVTDISSKFNEFLQRAAKDPDIVNYYNQLLQQAGQDTQLAEQYLESDYQTGIRNTISNLQGSLQQLGLTFKQENQQQQDTLNKRGIAVTQGADGKLQYGGGEAGNEISQTQQSQQLRQEAEQRTAQQNVTGLQATLQKGISSAGSQLAQTGLNLKGQMANDVMSRANSYMGLYNDQQAAAAQAAAQKKQNQLAGMGSPYVGQGLTQQQLPSELFNNIGTTTYQGVNYNVQNTGKGTRNISLA